MDSAFHCERFNIRAETEKYRKKREKGLVSEVFFNPARGAALEACHSKKKRESRHRQESHPVGVRPIRLQRTKK